MKKVLIFGFATLTSLFISCEKEYSTENNQSSNPQVVGVDCRISKITYSDTATQKGIGSIAADIDSLDIVTRITAFDSLGNIIEFRADPFINNDTIHINANEYFLKDVNNRIIKLHGLSDPTDPLSPQFDAGYFYDGLGYLSSKIYAFTANPGVPFYRVTYSYNNNNLVQMTATDLTTGNLVSNASLEYQTNIIPRRYIYIFPDEIKYSYYNQFYNFGQKSYNAIKKLTVRNFNPGNTVRDSIVSNFSNYIMSRDTYVFSVQMSGDNQPSIPAKAGKLDFSYKCK